MQHDVTAAVTRLLAGLVAGRPRGMPSEVTLVPLSGGHGAAMPPSDAHSGLVLSETTPPDPGSLRAGNSGRSPVTVHTGDVFAGGLADRAVRSPYVLRPDEERLLAVEALESRWWWTRPLVPEGVLDPARSALVALAGLEVSGGVSAAARTGLWALGHRSVEQRAIGSDDQAPEPLVRGWILLTATQVLAARIWVRWRPLAGDASAEAVVGTRAVASARQFLGELAAARWSSSTPGIANAVVDGLNTRVLHRSGMAVEVGAVLPDHALPAVLARNELAS